MRFIHQHVFMSLAQLFNMTVDQIIELYNETLISKGYQVKTSICLTYVQPKKKNP